MLKMRKYLCIYRSEFQLSYFADLHPSEMMIKVELYGVVVFDISGCDI